MTRRPVQEQLRAIDGEDAVTRIASRLGEDASPGERISIEYADEVLSASDEDGDEIDIDAFDPRLPEHAEGFADFVRAKAHEEFHAAVYRLSCALKLRSDGRIEVWREMVVPDGWHLDGVRERPLGVYWSYDEGAAEAHWGGGEGVGTVRVVVHALVDLDGIDWTESVVANAVEESTVGEESEVRLTEKAEVEVIGIGLRPHRHRPVRPLDVSHLQGEMLAAGDEAQVSLPAPR